MSLRRTLPTCMAMVLALALAGPASAAPHLSPFYKAVNTMQPVGKLGQVIARVPVATAIRGAQA